LRTDSRQILHHTCPRLLIGTTPHVDQRLMCSVHPISCQQSEYSCHLARQVESVLVAFFSRFVQGLMRN